MSEENPPNDDGIRDLRARIEVTPHDLALRLELGAALLRHGDSRAAIPELQLAQQDPARRIEATRLLADAFEALGMLDLAASRHLPLRSVSEKDQCGIHTSPAKRRS